SALTWLATKTAGPSRSASSSRPRTVRRQKLPSAGNSRLDCRAARMRRMPLVRAHSAASTAWVSTGQECMRASADARVGGKDVGDVDPDHSHDSRVVGRPVALEADPDVAVAIFVGELLSELRRRVLQRPAASVCVVVDLARVVRYLGEG